MFTFKGISTKEMRIIVEEPDNLIAKAPIKHEILNIEGRDDAIYYPLGRSPIEISLTLQLLDPSKVDQVLMWLDGEGELIYKDRRTKARIFSEVQPIRTSGIRLITIDVVRAPYWDVITDDYSKPWGANLIKNGWDSFEPYGSGENYVKNWNFVNNDLSEFKTYATGLEIKDNILTVYSPNNQPASSVILNNIGFIGRVMVRVKMKAPNGSRIYGHTGTDKERINIDSSNVFQVYELELNILEENNQIYIYTVYGAAGLENSKLEIAWVQVTPIDNQHLVIEKRNLDNGLIHIQTWGGSNARKLVSNMTKPIKGIRYKYSLFIDNKLDSFVHIRSNSGVVDFKIGKGSKNLSDVEVSQGELWIGYTIRTLEINDRLDFIASTPTIVEGDKPPTWDADEYPRIVNEGNAVAKPLIRLTKGTSNTCEFEVNGVYFKYHFNQDDEVIIDCEKMEASDEGQLRNRHLTIGYEFPKLDPGPNVVKTISGDAIIEFKRKDRWL